MKTSNSQSIKRENTKLVVEKLVELHETSRVELARITTLNRATVSSIIADLMSRDIVVETGESVKTSGRSAKVIALNRNAGRIISIELLTNSIYGVIANLYGKILYEVRNPVENPEFKPYLEVLLKTIDELRKNTYDSTYGVIGIGIGVYGILSKDKKIVFTPFTSWKDIELKKIVEDYTGIDTYVENEANITALGENIVYANQENLISLNIGIGVGMGIIIDKKLYTGEDGYAGEIGHNILIPNGKKCVCGNYGCLEKYISDPGIIERYFEASNERITIDEFINRYHLSDKYATLIYKEFIEYLSVTINNISHSFNPKTIVIQGKIVENISETISLVKNKLRSQIMKLDVLTTSMYKSKTNVLGLTHVLIHDFLMIDHYQIKQK